MQAVNPRVTVPYWDYTIDVTAYELSGDIDNNDPYVNRFNLTYGFSAVGGSGPSDRRKLLGLQSDIAKRRRSLLAEEDRGGSAALAGRRQVLQTKDQEAKDAGTRQKTAPAARRGGQNERRRREVKAKDRKLGKKGHRELRGLSTEGADAEDAADQRMRDSLSSSRRRRKSHGGGGVARARRAAGRKRRLEGTTPEFESATCGALYAAMQATAWHDFGKQLEGQPHGGTIHAWALLAFGVFKDMWRAGEVCTCHASALSPV